MATNDPFDIRNYERPTLSPDELARANRQRRVAQFGEEAVARAERAGRTFAGATDGLPSQRAATGSPNPPPKQTPKPRVRPKLAPAPAPTGVVGKIANAGKRVAGPLAVGLGALETVRTFGSEDTTERDAFIRKLGLGEVNDRGEPTGFISRGDKVLGATASFVNNALFGAPEAVYDLLNPQQPAPPVEQGVAETSPVVDFPVENTPADDTIIGQTPGTGVIRNNQTGEETLIDVRGSGFGGGRIRSNRKRNIQGTGIPFIDAILNEAFEQLPGRVDRANQRAQAALLAGQADLLRAQTAATKPDATEVVENVFDPTNPSVIQVRNGVARQLPVETPQSQLTPEQAIALGRRDIKNGKSREQVLKILREEFGLDISLEEL